MNSSTRKLTGKKGEDEAVAFLRACGIHVIERNYRSGRSEIDIIAQRDDCILFIEVKNRMTDNYGSPEEFVSSGQQERILEAAEEWLAQNNWTGKIRFDIIAISKQSGLLHIQDAFF